MNVVRRGENSIVSSSIMDIGYLQMIISIHISWYHSLLFEACLLYPVCIPSKGSEEIKARLSRLDYDKSTKSKPMILSSYMSQRMVAIHKVIPHREKPQNLTPFFIS